MENAFTRHYKRKKHKSGYSFIFYCDLCNKKYCTDIIPESSTNALITAQKIAKQYFNKCHQCGKWICDEHYDENNMQCVECSAIQVGKDRKKQIN